jgi:hypothetical protein
MTKAYYEELGAFCAPIISNCERHTTWPEVCEIFNAGLPDVLRRRHPQDSVEAARYWKQGPKAEDDEEEDEDEALLNRQAREGQVRGNMQVRRDQEEEAGREDQEEPKRKAQVRRRTWITLERQRQRQRAIPTKPP